MDDLMDLMISAESPSQISDQIKDALFAKSAARIEDLKPAVANTLFGEDEVEEVEDSISDEIPEEEEE
jgi:hypothetical protein|tara:strand:- start:202 stop:405 length:204 start_codon:yes stop_codon:yes gene_type:complete